MQLEGKTVFITGGTGGIGRPLVTLLQQSGARVYVYDRASQGDLLEQIDAVCAMVTAAEPDILINLAGYNCFARCEDQPADDIIGINLTVPIRLSQAVLPTMRKRGTGQIVNIGSMTALIPLPHLGCYVAAKAGLKAFSDSLRREVQGSGIVITHVTPRAVDTDANKGLKAELNAATRVAHDSADLVARRIVTAILNGESEVRIGWPERFFAVVNALLPRLIDRALRKNRDIGERILARQSKSTPYKKKTTMKRIAMLMFAVPALSLSLNATAVHAQEMSAPVPVQIDGATLMAMPDPVMDQVAMLQTRWAEIKYQGAGKDAQLAAMTALEGQAAALVAANPTRAEPKIWDAIILSSEAGIIKGISALPKVKKAKVLLEASLLQDANALEGSAHTSLGSLYYQVPGWPVGFGDKQKAEEHLKAALAINPDGIDPNYFYGDYLNNQERYAEAIPVLEKALAAPDRPNRALADAGRRQEIRAALAVAQEKAKTQKRNDYN